MSTKVSVLVAVWNSARYFREALESALAQTRKAHEIIVVDDGSSDESASIAESYPEVRCIREVHRGVAPTRNTALTHVTGDLVAWLDADDVWTSDKLEVQAGFMDAHPEIGMTFTHQRLVFEAGVERPYWVREEMIGADSPVVGTCSMMARAHLFPQIGDFDETKTPADDSDWIFRAKQVGVGYLTLPETLLIRRVHAENLSTVKPMGRPQVLGLLRASINRKRTGPTS